MQLLNTFLIGLTAGAIYALMAIAFVLVWRSTRVVNFAQAGMALLSTYFGYEAVSRLGSFWIALPVAMIGGALFAALVELVLMRLLVKHASSGPIAGVAPIIATLGLLGLIQAIIGFIWLLGLFIIHPNQTKVIEFFGRYEGTVTSNGWASPGARLSPSKAAPRSRTCCARRKITRSRARGRSIIA